MPEPRYWLFKSEPATYSWDDLTSEDDQTAEWDGVRNYQARNFMRDAMRVGDCVLFYHSNAKPPGVIGIARIVREAYPDDTAWNPDTRYYDPKSDPANPTWLMVDIKAERKLPRFVSLNELKANPALSDMLVTKRGQRLSIQPVTAAEWAEVLANGGAACRVAAIDMDAQQSSSSLEVEVVDFGPIVHGKVDLRPMTVFIGPSNTGKSYLAILLYALHRFFSGDDIGVFGFPRRAPFMRGQPDISSETVAALTELLRKAAADKLGRFEQRDLFLPDAVVALLRSQFDNLGAEVGSAIARYFGLNDAATLVRQGRNTQARLVLQHSLPNGEKTLTHTLLINARQTSTQFTIPEHLVLWDVPQSELASALPFTDAASPAAASDFGLFGFWGAVNLLMKWLVPGMVDSLRLPAFYLPAGRTGVMHAHTAIVSAMLERATMAGLEPAARTPMLSGVLVDFLRQLIEINSKLPYPHLPWRLDGVRDIDVQIEQSIINGEIRVSHSEVINYPRFTYRPNGWKADLPLLNASSMVSEIGPRSAVPAAYRYARQCADY